MDNSNEKLYRTLIRVVSKSNYEVECIVPAYSHVSVIALLKKDIPENIFKLMKPGFRCHVRMNIGAYKGDDLIFKNWEVK